MRNQKKRWFQKARLRESNEELGNPGCGWYHVYPFVLEVPSKLSFEETKLCILDISKEEQLVLVRIDIGCFRSCEIPKAALEDVSRIFELFHISHKQMILRFTYDSEGKGIEREPGSISLVKRHMEQLGELVRRFSADILVLQGIFVGSWAEMHHSKFLSASDMSELMGSLYHAVKDSCYLAVRTPEQWRRIIRYPGADPALQARMGLFNDGMFGSPTDLGTYGESSRQDELEWQREALAFVPNGGEALAGKTLIGYCHASKEMEKMHLSYLNSSYQKEQLDYWKKERVRQLGCWKGISGYEYIGRHLGYRLTVCDVRAIDTQLEIVIENKGFAGVYEEAECFLVIEGTSGETECQYIDTRGLKWESGEKTVLWASLSDMGKEARGSRIFLFMRQKKDGRFLRFANQDSGDRVLLGTLK